MKTLMSILLKEYNVVEGDSNYDDIVKIAKELNSDRELYEIHFLWLMFSTNYEANFLVVTEENILLFKEWLAEGEEDES